MASNFERLTFTKDWNSSTDFPTYQDSEAQVRADQQLLHDETRDFINNKLIPGIEGMAVPGSGDMKADMYDPNGKRTDIFRYADEKAASVAKTAAQAAAEAAGKAATEAMGVFSSVLAGKLGALELLSEFTEAGEHEVTIPEDTALIYAVIISAGSGGGTGTWSQSGSGGQGGNALLLGPVLPDNIMDSTVVVGAGGEADCTGGSSSAFGVVVPGGECSAGFLPGGKGGDGSDLYPKPGESSSLVIPMTLRTFSAGGGGGSGTEQSADGGTCSFGSGGKGGCSKTAGFDGAQCCGGGGGGSGTYEDQTGSYPGGRGGDGYVAVWIQRKGGMA